MQDRTPADIIGWHATKKPPGSPQTARGYFYCGHNATSQTEINKNRFYKASSLLVMTVSGKSLQWFCPACPQMITTNGQQQSS